MSIPFFRCVRYEGDGVYNYQCLSCYAKFDNGCRFGYCPFCGIQFHGFRFSREQGEWKYPIPERYTPAKKLGWEVQVRTRWDETDEWSPWQRDIDLYYSSGWKEEYRNKPQEWVHRILTVEHLRVARSRKSRSDKYIQREYRIARVES